MILLTINKLPATTESSKQCSTEKQGKKKSEAGGRQKGDGAVVRGKTFPRPLGEQGD